MSDLPEWLETALDVGVYPASGPGERVRTPYEDGYNDAVFEITERIERAWIENGNGLREVAHKAAEIGFTYGALGRDYKYVLRNVDDMLVAKDNRYAWCESCGYAHPVDDPDCLKGNK